jgi:hypothetical protein
MIRHSSLAHLVLTLSLGVLGCSQEAPADASAPDARVTRAAAPFDAGPIDAFVIGPIDAFCGQTEPDPDRTVTCSPCEPHCYLTREQPGPDDLGEGLEHDLLVNGVRLSRGSDGRYVAEGSHERVYDATLSCDPLTELPVWDRLDYDVEIPPGTTIDFELRAASSLAELPAAPTATVPARSGYGSFDVSFALASSGSIVSLWYLSIPAVLRASADGTQTPVLRRHDLRFLCLPGM